MINIFKYIAVVITFFSLTACTPNIIPENESGTVETVEKNTALKEVKSWFYYLYFDLDIVLEDIIDSSYDMIVLEPIMTEKENEDYEITEAVKQIKDSKGGNLENKLVLAYIDIGQAESYRYYWQDDWEIGNPDFIAGEDPDMWEDNYPVAFWRNEWQDIWLQSNNLQEAQIKSIIDAGFDGVYLDWVEAYSDENVLRIAKKDKVDGEQEMINFIQRIKEYGQSVNPNFLVIAQNASELAEHNDYVSIIDGIAQEQVWFDGSALGEPQGDCPLPATDEDIDTEAYYKSLLGGCQKMYTELPDSTLHVSSEEYIKSLTYAKNQGLPIFTVDYALEEENIKTIYEESESYGFIPFVSNRPLDIFIEQ